MKLNKYTAVLLTILLIQFSQVEDSISSSKETSSTKAPLAGQNDKLQWDTKVQFKLPEKPVSFVHSLDNKSIFVLTENNEVLIYSSKGELKGSVPVNSGVTKIDISPYGDTLYLMDTEENSFKAVSVDFVIKVKTGDSAFIGHKDAPVTIMLFTDFECPYCRQIPAIMEKVLKKNQDSVKLVLKNLPLRMHKFAEQAARAALAAKEQGKFWEFHDELFSKRKLDATVINGIAIKLGLDMDAFNRDRMSSKITNQLRKEMQEAEVAGISGTPAIYINGRKLKNRSPEGFQKVIDEELAKSKK